MGRPESAPLPTGFKFIGLDALYGKGKSKAAIEPREFARPAKVSRIERLQSAAAPASQGSDCPGPSCGSNEGSSGSGAGPSGPVCIDNGAGPSRMAPPASQHNTEGSANDDSDKLFVSHA